MVSRTLRMLRFRGKRFWFLVFAVFATFLIFRWSNQSEATPQYDFPIPKKVEDVSSKNAKQLEVALPPAHEVKKTSTTSVPVAEETLSPSPSSSPLPSSVTAEDEDQDALETPVAKVEQTPTPSSTPPPPLATSTLPKIPTVPEQGLPDRQKHPVNPLNGKYPPIPSTTTIYWQSQVERFPVPTESIIQLPTGSAAAIPKIQFDFKEETPDVKIAREKRQAQVKKEFQKAWKGYRENAWFHDELSPVSGGFRDPFCGWAATLVDGLDTVYIMGLETEFEDAVKAVGKLDFTTSQRMDIPMFETTIRYLGGLVAAYDVSGHKHRVLLDKAVELADVLLGAFDTPNRMPVLFYEWTPASAALPHRAPRNANTAELGSLSLEFTRLAQLTQNPRYYDAVARISLALSEWLDRGTTGLDGVFPEEIDASGCNRTENSLPSTIPVPISRGKGGGRGGSNSKEQPLEGKKDVGKPKAPAAPNVAASELRSAPDKPTLSDSPTSVSTHEQSSHLDKRALPQEKVISNTTAPFSTNSTSHDKTIPRQIAAYTNPNFKTPSRVVEEEDCKPQGLISSNPNGMNRYGMGGGQDSTYEYMPKQYLLLGGREQIHGTMYLKAVEAIRKDMLFRPMVPGNKDLLFAGALSKSLGPRLPEVPVPPMVMTPEVEHLTCFIGGMIGMGAKIFELEGDLELAKRLTDGCVWAYSAFASGIMPEGAQVVPCDDRSDCTWDEPTWHLALDPLGKEAREKQIAAYIENKAKVEAEREAMTIAAAKEQAALEEKTKIAEAAIEEDIKPVKSEAQSGHVTGSSSEQDTSVSGELSKLSNSTPNGDESETVASPVSSKIPEPKATPLDPNRFLKDEPAPPQKRGLEGPPATKSNTDGKFVQEELESTPFFEKSEPRPNTDLKTTPADESLLDDVKPASSLRKAVSDKITSPKDIVPSEGLSEQNDKVDLEAKSEFPLFDPTATTNGRPEPDYMMPLTHKQAVDGRIEQEGLPPGFTYIRSRKYILRPEAIESVWYMYRITGDPIWQEKGWKMFEAVIAATSAPFGHSAVEDVTVPEPPQIDQMESFWLAETLKYFYLLFSTPDTISLDEWVLNTEAHPFKRPEPNAKSAS